MFVKRNRHRSSDKKPTSILLVHGERVRRDDLPKDAKGRRTRVVHRTVANLSKLPPELVSLIEAYCRGHKIEVGDAAKTPPATIGRCYGQLGAALAIANALGVSQALGDSRLGRLALFLVLARVIHQGSRLSAVSWATQHAVREVLGIERFDEDDLYDALDWLEKDQERIEISLAKRRPTGTLFLYDVTSSYLEGQQNELAAPGYNRDGKRFKKQIVIGLLTDDQGDPVSIRVYPGNTSDPKTVADPVRFLADKVGAKDVIFVGDRGMVKAAPRELLAEHGFRFLTALTDAQIRSLLQKRAIQLELFDETPAEVDHDGRRLILRLNPDTRRRDRQRRGSQLAKVRAKVAERNALVRERSKADPNVSLAMAEKSLASYRLDRFVTARLAGREVFLDVDGERQGEVELLDGCYVLETNAPKSSMDTAAAHARYMDLTKVERDFRTIKTDWLEIRPIYLRNAERTRGHALVAMLALKVARELTARVRKIGLNAEQALERLSGVRLVTLVDPKLDLWQLPTTFDRPQREVLESLPPLPAPRLSLRAKAHAGAK